MPMLKARSSSELWPERTRGPEREGHLAADADARRDEELEPAAGVEHDRGAVVARRPREHGHDAAVDQRVGHEVEARGPLELDAGEQIDRVAVAVEAGAAVVRVAELVVADGARLAGAERRVHLEVEPHQVRHAVRVVEEELEARGRAAAERGLEAELRRQLVLAGEAVHAARHILLRARHAGQRQRDNDRGYDDACV